MGPGANHCPLFVGAVVDGARHGCRWYASESATGFGAGGAGGRIRDVQGTLLPARIVDEK